MGAHNIEFEIDKKASWSEIKSAFDRQKEQDKVYNGPQQGYSGDFQTVNEVKDHTYKVKVFSDYNEAHNYCMEKAEKWISVVAVYYYDFNIKQSKKLEKIGQRIKDTRIQLNELKCKPVKLAKFVTCEGCGSKVSSQHIKSVTCPVCHEGDFRPLGLQKSIKKLEVKIKLLEENYTKLKQDDWQKLILKQKDDKNIKTLVAGWGAS